MTICAFQYSIISGHFSPNCMFIFHKNEVQTVILRCLMSLNLNWFKSYDTKSVAIFQKLAELAFGLDLHLRS